MAFVTALSTTGWNLGDVVQLGKGEPDIRSYTLDSSSDDVRPGEGVKFVASSSTRVESFATTALPDANNSPSTFCGVVVATTDAPIDASGTDIDRVRYSGGDIVPVLVSGVVAVMAGQAITAGAGVFVRNDAAGWDQWGDQDTGNIHTGINPARWATGGADNSIVLLELGGPIFNTTT